MLEFLTLSAAALLSLLLPQACRGMDCVNAPWNGMRDVPSLLGALLHQQPMAHLSLTGSPA